MTPRTSGRCSRRVIIKRVLIACVAVACMSAKSEARFFYNFVEEETDDVLATLELTSLPASLEEIAGLTFTPKGDAIFGFGLTYTGTFDDITTFNIVDDGSNGLTHDGVCTLYIPFCHVIDNDPPASTVLGGITSFAARFYSFDANKPNFTGNDSLWT